jgi:hypothetical protein
MECAAWEMWARRAIEEPIERGNDRCKIMGRNGNPVAEVGEAVQFVSQSLQRVKVGAMFFAEELAIEQVLNLFKIVFDA